MKIAVVTGASGVIGRSIAEALSEEGYALALCYNTNQAAAKETVSSLSSRCPAVLLLQGDVFNADDVARIANTVRSRLGVPEVLVNCAGVSLKQKLFTDTSEAEIEKVFNTNIIGPMLLTKAMIPFLLEKGNGSVINIASMWGLVGASCETVYSSSKAALIGFTKALAKELAPSGLRVNAVAPGLVLSPMNSGLSKEELESFREDTPLQRFTDPNDVAKAVCYLLGSPSVTGQVLSVDGGIVI